MLVKFNLLIFCFVFLVGCATPPHRIDAKPVDSKMQNVYKEDYDCQQLFDGMKNEIKKASELYKTVSDDSLQDLGLSVLVLSGGWPAVFFMGNNPESRQFSYHKGHYESMREAAMEKKCDYYSIPEWQPDPELIDNNQSP